MIRRRDFLTDVVDLTVLRHGIDAVIVTPATWSSGPTRQATNMYHQRGRIVLIGVTGLKLRSSVLEEGVDVPGIYSYSPGRYEMSYEPDDLELPIDFVR